MRIQPWSFLLGLGVASVLPIFTRVLRPLAVEATVAGMAMYDEGRRMLAEQMENIEDIAAEARARREEMLAAVKFLRAIAAQEPLKGLIAEELRPGPQVTSDEALIEDFRQRSGTVYHPCCTARMGAEVAASVADPRQPTTHDNGTAVARPPRSHSRTDTTETACAPSNTAVMTQLPFPGKRGPAPTACPTPPILPTATDDKRAQNRTPPTGFTTRSQVAATPPPRPVPGGEGGWCQQPAAGWRGGADRS